MKKVIRLTEAELTNLIKKVIQEQATIKLPMTTGGNREVKVPSSNGVNLIDTCASMGIKGLGYCDTKEKKPVKPCKDLGSRSPGYCYVDTKQPVPNWAKAKSGQSIQEAAMGVEPILDKKNRIFGNFFFGEGKTKPSSFNGGPVTQAGVDSLIKEMAMFIKDSGTLKTLQNFSSSKVGVYKNAQIPKFITLAIGTSHTGSGETNSSVAQGRYNFLAEMVMKAFDLLGVDSSIARSVVITSSDSAYRPSNLDKNFFDPKKVKPEDIERYGAITITPLVTKGNDTRGIQNIQKGLNNASSVINNIIVDGVDEQKIVDYIRSLQTFSDIQDLNDAINAGGKWPSLERFLNSQLFDDPKEMREVVIHLQKLATESGKQKDTIRLLNKALGQEISIGLGA